MRLYICINLPVDISLGNGWIHANYSDCYQQEPPSSMKKLFFTSIAHCIGVLGDNVNHPKNSSSKNEKSITVCSCQIQHVHQECWQIQHPFCFSGAELEGGRLLGWLLHAHHSWQVTSFLDHSGDVLGKIRTIVHSHISVPQDFEVLVIARECNLFGKASMAVEEFTNAFSIPISSSFVFTFLTMDSTLSDLPSACCTSHRANMVSNP